MLHRIRAGWIPDTSGDLEAISSQKIATSVNIAATVEDIDELKRHLSDLQQRLSSLQAHQQVLLTLEAPVRRLPVDLLEEIFIHFVPIWGEEYAMESRKFSIGHLSPFTLASVCRRWRDAALSFPRIWSTIKLDVTRHGRHESSSFGPSIEAIQLHLQRSTTHPLSVILRGWLKTDSDKARWKTLASTSLKWERLLVSNNMDSVPPGLQEGIPGVRSLVLPVLECAAPGNILQQWLMDRNMNGLQTISVPFPSAIDHTHLLLLSKLETLKSIEFIGPTWLSQRRNTQPSTTTLNELMEALPPSVDTVRFVNCSDTSYNGFQIRMPNIKALGLAFARGENKKLLRAFDLSSLSALSISCPPSLGGTTASGDAGSAWKVVGIAFKGTVFTKLRHLTLQGLPFSFNHDPLRNLLVLSSPRLLLEVVPMLQSLDLTAAHPVNSSDIVNIAELLSPNRENLLPDLQRLRVGPVSRDIKADSWLSFFDTVESRFRAGQLKEISLICAEPVDAPKIMTYAVVQNVSPSGWPWELVKVQERITAMKDFGLGLSFPPA